MTLTLDPRQSWILIQTQSDEFFYFRGPFSQNPKLSTSANNGVYINDFWLDNPYPYYLSPAPPIKLKRLDLLEFISKHAQPQGQKFDWVAPDKEAFRKEFNQLKHLFSLGLLEKAVPGVQSSCQVTGADSHFVASSLGTLIKNTSSYPLYTFAISMNGCLQWGATPEILFSSDRQRLQTMALAGTRPRAEQDLLMKSIKDNREHDLVVHDIVERLKDLGKIHLGQKSALLFPSLCHLHTPIEVQLSQTVSFQEGLQRLHPTPALGVSPRHQLHRWKKLYESLYPHNPKNLGAPLGLILKDTFSCLVRIRYARLHVSSGQLFIEAGCGVIAESQFEQEWQELLLKLSSIKRNLGFEPITLA